MGPDDAELHVGEVSAAADHGRGPQRRREGRPGVLARDRHGLLQVVEVVHRCLRCCSRHVYKIESLRVVLHI